MRLPSSAKKPRDQRVRGGRSVRTPRASRWRLTLAPADEIAHLYLAELDSAARDAEALAHYEKAGPVRPEPRCTCTTAPPAPSRTRRRGARRAGPDPRDAARACSTRSWRSVRRAATGRGRSTARAREPRGHVRRRLQRGPDAGRGGQATRRSRVVRELLPRGRPSSCRTSPRAPTWRRDASRMPTTRCARPRGSSRGGRELPRPRVDLRRARQLRPRARDRGDRPAKLPTRGCCRCSAACCSR